MSQPSLSVNSKISLPAIFLALAVFSLSPSHSWAAAPSTGTSAGCTASNIVFTSTGRYDDYSLSPAIAMSSFSVGDSVTITITRTPFNNSSSANYSDDVYLDDPDVRTIFGIASNAVIPGNTPGPFTATRVITSSDIASGLSINYAMSYGSMTVSCTPAGGGGTTPSQSKVRSLQLAGTQVSSLTAANSLASGIGNNVANRLPLCPGSSGDAASGSCRAPGAAPNSGVGSPSYLGAKSRDSSIKDASIDGRANRLFNAWGDIKHSGFDRDDQSSLKQISAMGGLDFLLYKNFLLGVMGGYEHSDFKADVLQGTLKGNGSTVGIYGGYRFTPSIRGDFATTWTWLDYDVADKSTATPVTANFGAIRSMIAGGLTGSYMLGVIVVEPSARVMSLRQREESYAESSGAAQASRNFSAGRASFGSKFSLPYSVYGGLFVSPYAGIYADYRFGSDSSMTETAAVLGLSNGWSARTTAGLSLSLNPQTHAVTIGGELGGLGSDNTNWTWGARGSLRF